jgi:phospholipid/cholesterol/gamma-HCH transport system substrate-binding protein
MSTATASRSTGIVRSIAASRLFRWGLAVIIVAAAAMVAVNVLRGPATYPVTAVFAKAPGLFPGASVEVLGVQAGTVSSVKNVGDTVVVGMVVDQGRTIPATATASLASPQLLGEPDIELAPGYTSGPQLAPGATIPMNRTSVPVSTDQLLRSLEHTLQAINPHAVGDLVNNLAQDLQGQGQSLNSLIASAAGTLQLLANKGDDLGQLNGTLAQLTGSLDSRSAEISSLITNYDTVSGVVAQHNSQLGDAIGQLSGATTQVVGLLSPNLGPLEQDVGTITTVGQTLDRNISSVDQVLTQSVALFTAAQKAYDPTYNWLNLNNQIPGGVTGAYAAGLVRDRLAGVCRRIDANHAAGLTPTQLATLATCGNPSSGFFDAIIDQVPNILSAIPGGTPISASAAQQSPAAMLQQGLSEIPGASTPTTTPPTTTPPPTTAPPPTTTAPTSPSSPITCSGSGVLGSILCPKSSGSSSSSSAGLLSDSSPSAGSSKGSSSGAGATEAVQSSPSAPTLNLAIARSLPPMPGRGHGHGHGGRAPGGVVSALGHVGHDLIGSL